MSNYTNGVTNLMDEILVNIDWDLSMFLERECKLELRITQDETIFEITIEKLDPDRDYTYLLENQNQLKSDLEKFFQGPVKILIKDAEDIKDIPKVNNISNRSVSELRIAEVLERRKILFWPNARCRIGSKYRKTRETDFLICANGKFGILEVDGPDYHPSAAKDHGRDRLFKRNGVRVAERYPATECFENADGVVKDFLMILQRSYVST